MIRLGITGGIGSGKTYVCHVLQTKMGIPVYDSDSRARMLMQNDDHIRGQLIQLLGPCCYADDGQLNRELLASYLFASADHASEINGIVHPVVRRDVQHWFSQQHVPLAALESAILYESRFHEEVDKVIFVDAPLETRIRRAMQRDRATRQQVLRRMERQHADDARQRADYVLQNKEDSNIEIQLKQIIETLC